MEEWFMKILKNIKTSLFQNKSQYSMASIILFSYFNFKMFRINISYKIFENCKGKEIRKKWEKFKENEE